MKKQTIPTEMYVRAHRLEFSMHRLALNTDLTLMNTDVLSITTICAEKLNIFRTFRDMGPNMPTSSGLDPRKAVESKKMVKSTTSAGI